MAGLTPGQQIGINAASSAIGGVIGLANSALQHKYNKELAEYQYDKQLEMWDRQNEYNSPTAQRQRLEEAGLNPALMYGHGTVSTGNASTMPQYQQMGVDVSSNMLSAMQMLQMASNIRNIEADTEKKKVETGIGEVDLKYREEIIKADIENTLSGTAVNKQQLTNMIAELDNIKLQPALTVAMTDNYLQLVETNEKLGNKHDAEAGLIILKQTLVPYEKSLMESQKNANDANATNNLASAANLNAKTVYQEWYNSFIQDNGYAPDANLQQLVIQLLGGIANHLTGGEGGVQDAVNTLVDQFVSKQRSWAERQRDKDAQNPNSIFTKKMKAAGKTYNFKTHQWE